MKSQPLTDEVQVSLIKSLWRDQLKRYFEAHHLSCDGNVLFLPGSQAKELEEIYDVLGFNRQKIWGVEQNAEVALELQDKQLGINIVSDSLNNFLRVTEAIFNIISADLQSALLRDDEISALLFPICQRHLLNPSGFLIINKFDAREGDIKNDYFSLYDSKFQDTTYPSRQKIHQAFMYKICAFLMSHGMSIEVFPPVLYNSGSSPMFTTVFKLTRYSNEGVTKSITQEINTAYNSKIDLGVETHYKQLEKKGITTALDLATRNEQLGLVQDTLLRLSTAGYNCNIKTTYDHKTQQHIERITPTNIYRILNDSIISIPSLLIETFCKMIFSNRLRKN